MRGFIPVIVLSFLFIQCSQRAALHVDSEFAPYIKSGHREGERIIPANKNLYQMVMNGSIKELKEVLKNRGEISTTICNVLNKKDGAGCTMVHHAVERKNHDIFNFYFVIH